MKIAILADIHGNYGALEACLNYIDLNGFDGVVFLGDYITDCPYPQKTIGLVKETMSKYKTWLIRGNREDYLINHHYNGNDGWKYSSKSGSLLYTYECISAEDIRFFEAMPISQVIKIDGCKPFTVCHGSPINSCEALLPNADNSNYYLKTMKTDNLFCGHSHTPFRYQNDDRYLINCGSVGISENGQTCAQFITIEYIQDKWKDSLISVPYDIEKMVADFEASGILKKGYYWSMATVKSLQTGENFAFQCVVRADELAEASGEVNTEFDLPEKYWEQAAKELGII